MELIKKSTSFTYVTSRKCNRKLSNQVALHSVASNEIHNNYKFLKRGSNATVIHMFLSVWHYRQVNLYLIDVVIIRPIKKNLIQAGLFCCLLVGRPGVCLGQRNEDVSNSSIQDLIRKIHEQDEKIAAIEANAKLDRRDLVSKILMLEEKLKDSDNKRKKLEKTIENLDNIIKELEIKT